MDFQDDYCGISALHYIRIEGGAHKKELFLLRTKGSAWGAIRRTILLCKSRRMPPRIGN
jgi:hypothetical protein